MGKKRHELIPSAHRLITSLRDMGYDFSAAVADVVDNSIEALASKVEIDVHSEGDDSWVRITDNGVGMKSAQIREALRYGTARKYDEKKSLGKFGLGLKTASMSQCQYLTVSKPCSNARTAHPDISAHAWDLSHVMATDRWEILEVGRDDYPDLWREPVALCLVPAPSCSGAVSIGYSASSIRTVRWSKKRLAGMLQERVGGTQTVHGFSSLYRR